MYLAFGMPVAMLGVAWPTLRDELGRSNGDLGLLALVYGLGRLVTSPTSGAVLARLPFGAAAALTLVGLAGGSVWVAAGPTWPALVAAFALIGVLSGLLDSLGARFLAVSASVGRAGLAAGSYGVGATVGPVVLATSDSVAVGYLTAAAVAVVAAATVAAPGLDWPTGERWAAAHEAAGADELGLVALLRAPGVAVSLALFFVFVGIEVTAGSWLATVLEDARGVDGRTAGLAVGAFWGGITVGRLLLGRLVATERTLRVAVAVLLATVVALAVAPAALVVPLALVAGLALAPQFPTLLAHTGHRVGADRAGRVSGWQLVGANIGGTGLAALTGAIVAATGPAAPLVVLVVIILAGAALLITTATEHPPA